MLRIKSRYFQEGKSSALVLHVDLGTAGRDQIGSESVLKVKVDILSRLWDTLYHQEGLARDQDVPNNGK